VTLGAPITLFSERGNWAGLNYWRAPILLGVPGVYHNPSNLSVTNNTGTAILGPGQLSFYPGPNGEFCIIRFTAPTNGLYQVSGAFTGVDPHGTITDVHVLVNGVTFNGSVNGYGAGSGPTFNLIVDLNTGDPIDFAVGRSANSQFSFDSTGLSVQISTSNTPPAGIPPTITSQPQSRTVQRGHQRDLLCDRDGDNAVELSMATQHDQSGGCDGHVAHVKQRATGQCGDLFGTRDQCVWRGHQFQRGAHGIGATDQLCQCPDRTGELVAGREQHR
jgi:hypothetical protein